MSAPDIRWHPRDLSMFDVGRWQQLDHEDIQPRIAHVMGNMLQAIAGGCQSGYCKVCLAVSPNSGLHRAVTLLNSCALCVLAS